MRYNGYCMKYLVVGLESSCTKAVSQMIAFSLGLINSPEEWDGHEKIERDDNVVCHRSMPHHYRNYFIDDKFASEFDFVVVVTRDWNCSLESKIISHTPNRDAALSEHTKGIEHIKSIVSTLSNVYIFSYETAFLLQDIYTIPFLKMLSIQTPKHIEFKNVNQKYMATNNG